MQLLESGNTRSAALRLRMPSRCLSSLACLASGCLDARYLSSLAGLVSARLFIRSRPHRLSSLVCLAPGRSAVLRTRVHARFLSSLACLASGCSAALELQMQSFSLVLPISRRCETAKEFLTRTWYCILSSLKAKTFPRYRKCFRTACAQDRRLHHHHWTRIRG